MLNINKKMYIIETRWEKTMRHIHLKIDSPTLYYYTTRTEIYAIVTNAYLIRNEYSLSEVSSVLNN
jgi:hypothetical protein|nr:MAG TPA: hypothetical protein [Caudoviricetes sp.]